MKLIFAVFSFLVAVTLPVHAITVDDGVVVFTQADALAGNITPGDAPGFPVTISVIGSYRLGSNLQIATVVSGIEVNAPEVSIDLGGFRIASGGVGRHGIVSFQRGLSVRNGTVRAFSLDGVRSVGGELLVENMRLAGNERYGVNEDSSTAGASMISRNVITGNAFGVRCTKTCQIEGNNISNNGSTGVITISAGSTILGNTISFNGTDGINGHVSTGFGNNTIVGNGLGSTTAAMLLLHPNACAPQAC